MYYKRNAFIYFLNIFLIAIAIAISTKAYAITIKFKPRWILNDQFSGELYAQEKLEKEKSDNQINISPYDETEDQYHAIVAGKTDISVGESITLLQNIERDGSDIVFLAMKEQISPAGYLSLKAKEISTPDVMEGKKIGVYSDGNIDQLKWFCRLHKINFNSIQLIKITSDNLGYLIDGKVDLIVAHDTNEPLVLKKMGYDTNFIPMYGPKSVYYGSVYFCRRDFYLKNKEAVKQFVKYVSEGWKWAIQNTEKAAAMVIKYYPAKQYLMNSKAFTQEKIKQGISIRAFHLTYNVGPNCIGCILKTQWDAEVDELIKSGIITQNKKLDEVVQYDLTEDLYRQSTDIR